MKQIKLNKGNGVSLYEVGEVLSNFSDELVFPPEIKNGQKIINKHIFNNGKSYVVIIKHEENVIYVSIFKKERRNGKRKKPNRVRYGD